MLLLGNTTGKGSRRQQDEASSHPAVGWKTPIAWKENQYTPSWTFPLGAPQDGV